MGDDGLVGTAGRSSRQATPYIEGPCQFGTNIGCKAIESGTRNIARMATCVSNLHERAPPPLVSRGTTSLSSIALLAPFPRRFSVPQMPVRA